jgi:hypothetical protein
MKPIGRAAVEEAGAAAITIKTAQETKEEKEQRHDG